LVVSPTQQFGKLVIVDNELGRADRADNCLTAIAASLAPFENSANCVAIPFAQVL